MPESKLNPLRLRKKINWDPERISKIPPRLPRGQNAGYHQMYNVTLHLYRSLNPVQNRLSLLQSNSLPLRFLVLFHFMQRFHIVLRIHLA